MTTPSDAIVDPSPEQLHDPSGLAAEIVENGFGIDILTPETAEHLDYVMANAKEFFDRIDEVPESVRTELMEREGGRAKRFTGFRVPGEEYAQQAERPDIMETFSLMDADMEDLSEETRAYIEAHPYMSRMMKLKAGVIESANETIRAIAGHYVDADDPEVAARIAEIDVSPYTFIQSNLYYPARYEEKFMKPGDTPLSERNYLQDPHEDGQFLTWAAAKQRGLVGRTMQEGTEFELVEPRSDQMLVMPSLPFTYWTGGPNHGGVPPFEHAVLASVDGQPIELRTSLIVFVNPDVTKPLLELVKTPENDGVSVPLMVNEAQWRFGLPRYEDPDTIPVDEETRAKTDELLEEIYPAEAA